MRVRLARKDAGRQQQMPMFVRKCANSHKHIFQKAYFRKWRHEKQFCAKLNGPHLSGMKLNVLNVCNSYIVTLNVVNTVSITHIWHLNVKD